MPEPVKIRFLGGAGTVTGSKTLVEYAGKRVLIDCGLFQGLKNLRQRNRQEFPLPPDRIDEVILTHAHLDHCGYLPVLVKQGFQGPIHCTHPTVDLTRIILEDSAKIQEEEAERANRHGYSRHTKAEPLYTIEDARWCVHRLVGHDVSETVLLAPDFKFQFHHSGHILGSAVVEIQAGDRVIVFSGDLGRQEPLLLYPPKHLKQADVIVIESTYGNRLHPDRDPEDELREIVLRTQQKGGILLIPTFAVERAQEILYYFARLKTRKEIPSLPVYLDSPMGVDATEIFFRYPQWHTLSREEVELIHNETVLIDSPIRYRAIVEDPHPKIVLAGSGMITGGRILHYLQRCLGDPKHTVLLAGFQAEGTRGRSLMEGDPEIKFFGEWHPVKAEVCMLSSLSAHGDQHDLLDWIGRFEHRPQKVLINHGEPHASQVLRTRIRDTFYLDAEVAVEGLTYKFEE